MSTLLVSFFAVGGVGCGSLARHSAPAGGDSAAATAGAAADIGGGAGVTCKGAAGEGASGAGQGATGAAAAPTNVASGAAGSPSVEYYAAVVKANSWCSDHEPDAKVRADLATQSSGAADACLALDSKAVACQYGKAVATGMEARAHPTRAVGLLGNMLQNLSNADSTDPNYDQAGPSRVRALVLIRAPSWPVGPGDPDAGLAAARRAASLQPNYPPNVLALAEALAKTNDGKGAHENYAHARDLAQALPAGAERDGWVRDAEDGLKR